MLKRSQFLVLILLTVAGVVMISPDTDADGGNSSVTVVVNGLRNQKGNVCVELFDQPKGFPTEKGDALTFKCPSAQEAATNGVKI